MRKFVLTLPTSSACANGTSAVEASANAAVSATANAAAGAVRNEMNFMRLPTDEQGSLGSAVMRCEAVIVYRRVVRATMDGQSHRQNKKARTDAGLRILAPRPGLEPGTYGLTVRRSTD